MFLTGKVGRFIRGFFPSRYRRFGSCRCTDRAAPCCRLGGITCPFLNRSTNLCRIYRFRPIQCRRFPQTPEDAACCGCEFTFEKR